MGSADLAERGPVSTAAAMGAGSRTLTRRLEFSASHRLHSPTLDEATNLRVFGKCNNPSGHGHDYTIEVTVEDTPGAAEHLESALGGAFEEAVDHKNLNVDVPFLEGVIPTAENLAARFFEFLEREAKGCRLVRLRLYEGPSNWVEIPALDAGTR